jgi:purine nucleosidase
VTRLVLDTDMGTDVDDALCLALGLASPELEIAALTCVGREARTRARVTRKLLQLAGREEIPVFAGCRSPVLGGRGMNWRGHEGEGILEPGEEPPIEAEHAVDALGRLFAAQPDLELVCVGPLTNVAVALMKDPDLAGRIRRLSVMGGHIREVAYGGQVFSPGLDYNLCSDPHASVVTLNAGLPTQLVTADVTLGTWITDADVKRLEATGAPLLLAIARAVRIWTPIQRQIFGGLGCDTTDDNVAFLHDPLTLACVHDESFCDFETLEIETTIADRVLRTLERESPSDATQPTRCALRVDAARFREYFVERLLTLV